MNASGKPFAYGWTAQTDYLGTINDQRIKGIRVRQGNVLIGNEHTLNTVFKDARFNGWLSGEVYVVDSKESKLIPNARRDDFEKNAAYFCFMEQMMQIAADRTKAIRSASIKRNCQLSAALSNAETACGEVSAVVAESQLTPQIKGSGRIRLTHW